MEQKKFAPKPFNNSGLSISFRPATSNDAAFINSLTNSVMKVYVIDIFKDNPEYFQEYLHINRLDIPNTHIITCQGKNIGRIAVTAMEGGAIRLHQLQLIPEYQKQGIGTQIIEQLIEFSNRQHKPLKLFVLENNPAKNLYTKLGFTICGEENRRLIMERPYQISTAEHSRKL